MLPNIYKNKKLTGILILLMLLLSLCGYLFFQINQLKEKIVKNQELLSWLETKKIDINALQTGLKKIETPKPDLQRLIAEDPILVHWKPNIQLVKRLDRSRVEITFINMPFDNLLQGIQSLWDKNNIRVTQIAVKKEDAMNHISAKAIFE